jgi:hypothetical protein
MVPAATALAQTAAAPKMRTGFFYIPHGAIMHNTLHGPAMDRWTPSGSGADFKLSPDSFLARALQEIRQFFRQPRECRQCGIGSHDQPGDLAERNASGYRPWSSRAHGRRLSIR